MIPGNVPGDHLGIKINLRKRVIETIMTKTICFTNNKGGSGKSTSCAAVGTALALARRRVLLVDGDMQMNLSLSFFDEDTVLEYAVNDRNIYHALKNEKDLQPYILQTSISGLDIIVSSTLMSSIEMELFTKWQRETILERLLKKTVQSGEYDYILIDAPPTLGNWAVNILAASDRVIIPVEASPWGLFGLANMFDFLSQVQRISPETRLLGVLVTKVDERKNYYRQTMETLKGLEEIHVFDQVIHVDSAVEWAQDASQTVVTFRRSSRSAKEYTALAEEIDKLIRNE